MNWLDAVIAIPIIWGAYQGFKKGIVYMIAMMIGLVLGLFLAFKLDGFVADLLGEYLNSQSKVIPFISFFIIVTIVVLLMIFLAKLFEGILKISSLNTFNKVGGAFLGATKYAFLISILLYLFRNFEPSITILSPQIRDESFSYKYVAGFSTLVSPALEIIEEEFKENLSKVDSVVTEETINKK